MKSLLGISIFNCRVVALLCLETAGFGSALAWAQSPTPDDAPQVTAGALSYSVTDLGTLGGSGSDAWGINNLGQVVGESQTADFNSHAFLWQDGKITDLGTLGGSSSVAYAINNEGQVVGYADTGHGMDFHAFIWQNGRMTDLGTLGGSHSVAEAINDKGQVVGYAETGHLDRHAFIWQNGRMTDLGTLGGSFGDASGINNMGQVTGTSTAGAFLLQNGKITLIGAGPGRFTNGRTINQKGEVAGYSTTAVEDAHAFLWRNGHTTDLGPGSAFAINDKDQVVGSKNSYAPLWQDGKVTDLNTVIAPGSGWVVGIAYAINNLGQIAGLGSHNGRSTAYLLTPVNKSLAVLQFSNDSWVFSAHAIGQTSGPGVIWVYNSSIVAAHFSKIQFTGANAQDFAVTANTCGSALAPFTTCKVVFDFTPTDIHDRNASLDLGDDAGGGPHLIPVIGFGSRQ